MEKLIKFKLVLIILIAWAGVSYAQQKQITGKVTSEEDGLPLPGVSVVVKGTTTGTATGIDGDFTLSVPSNATTLTFSFIGFEPTEVDITNTTNVSVKLKSSAVALDEVVAVGYGVVKKSDLTGAVSSVGADVMEAQPSLRVEEAIQGKVAGVLIQKTSGDPDGNMRVRIRGVNSLEGNNSPLYVIDGVLGASMSSINVNDIASIEVLKDASATAIYGSRGSNGVILVTTKSAKAGQTKYSLNTRIGFDKLIKDIDVASPVDFMDYVNFSYVNYGLEPAFSSSEIAEYENDPTKGTNWPDQLWRTGLTQDYQLSASGGTDKFTYYVSGTYTDVEAIVKNNDYQRFGVRSNLNAKLSDKINLTLNLNATRTTRNTNGASVGNFYVFQPIGEIYDEFGEYAATPSIGVAAAYNPVFPLNEQTRKTLTNRLSAMTNFEYKLTDYLTYSFTGAVETANATKSSWNRYEPDKDPTSSSAVIRDTENLMWQLTNQLTFFKDWGDHALTVSAVQEAQESTSTWNQTNASNFKSNSLTYYNLSLAENIFAETDYVGRQLSSYLGRINYNYKDKYLITASMRADGSSIFAEGNKWSYFPSAALGWRISEEDFFPEASWLDAAKVRLSYGEVGSQAVKPYQTLASLFVPDTGMPITNDETLEVPILLGDPANPDLKWETTAQYDVGFDMNMYSGRLNVNADYYYKKTTDLLYSVAVPFFAGQLEPEQIRNIGAMKNQGIELMIEGTPIQTKDFNLNLAFNFSKNVNEFLGIEGVDEDILLAGEDYNSNQMGGIIPFFLRKGEPLANIRALEYLGPYRLGEEDLAASYGYELGAPHYKDQITVDTNGDGIPDAPDGKIDADDAVVVGNGAPDYIWGFNISADYKNFDFSMFIQSVQGYEILNTNKFNISRYWTYGGLSDMWTPENNDTEQWAHVEKAFLQNGNTLYVEDGSFVRLKNITLGYTLPSSLTQKMGIEDLRIYVNAQNLWTLTDYTWFDPESSSTEDRDLSQGVYTGDAIPNPKSINFGLNLTF